MSWHNLFSKKEGLQNLLRELQKVTEPGCKLVISFLNSDIIFQNQKHIELSSHSYFKLLGKNKLHYQYSWRHSKTQIEYIMNKKEVIESLKLYGWNVDSTSETHNQVNISIDNPWKLVLDGFEILSFTRT